ncbi:hypothetical protein HPB52_001858 [Rhipicephalus sanguineus]|uniref:BEN domain-containing protein n=1 Tax=Rhipicephalus sanguineus TaxID=34632 RepID=A0A9D4PL62_RHISA|nr:hypothetical protein HPB52_001858 [Rhipicephalus sanguineus]
MFALVKFLKEFDSNRLYVVDSDSILDLHPRSTEDFDNRRVYSVFWVDEENSENTRAYEAQVLLLAESREELEKKKTSKRVPIPKIQMDTNSDDDKPPSKKQDHKEFHLAKGVIITASQAAKVLNNKKATLVCKDTAQAIWGTELLSERSVCGVAAPKARATGQLPKQPLTPTKVDVVAATVRHWGIIKGEDVSATVANITKVLSEKIQDARKSTKRLAAMSKINE